MANVQLIQKSIPQALWDIAAQYTIPDQFVEKKPQLVAMLLQSRSIEKPEEKQSWFNLLPLMNDEQIAKLEDILVREKQKLEEIEKKYEEKKVEIKKKYLMKRQEMGYVKKVEGIKQAEAKQDAQEDKEAEALLDQI
ncbi:hypothetical protein KBC03_00260 [Patescibacteria group bacterium]|nr:hypothetical protein [Patescibacteria group bacterium]